MALSIVMRLICFFLPLGVQIENFTIDVQNEQVLLKLRKIVCYITAKRTGSYNVTTGENQVLILRTMIVMFSVTN